MQPPGFGNCRGLKPATTLGLRMFPNVVAGFSPRSSAIPGAFYGKFKFWIERKNSILANRRKELPMHAGKKVYLLLVMALALTQGCGGAPAEPRAPDLKPVTYSENAMTPADRLEFYHLPEGSELFPVAWILYMESPKTKRPFIENLERFGLVPDPEGPL